MVDVTKKKMNVKKLLSRAHQQGQHNINTQFVVKTHTVKYKFTKLLYAYFVIIRNVNTALNKTKLRTECISLETGIRGKIKC